MSRTIRRKGAKECYRKDYYEEDFGKEKGDARYHSDMGFGCESGLDNRVKKVSTRKARTKIRGLLADPIDNEDKLVNTDAPFRKEAQACYVYSF